MTKAQWKELRVRKEWPLELFYNYWKEVKRPDHIELTLDQFEVLMTKYMTDYYDHAHPNTSGQMVMYDPSVAVSRVMVYYDKKFDINE